ncbi:hypothetical protein RIF29_08212 [Crotalaria pallida]|uniref:Uncharacterized protein n=1 Tax=Crotalaria pallida TaxID=3830 RepID=A0AAN9J5G2_CROPI
MVKYPFHSTLDLLFTSAFLPPFNFIGFPPIVTLSHALSCYINNHTTIHEYLKGSRALLYRGIRNGYALGYWACSRHKHFERIYFLRGFCYFEASTF